VPEEPTTIDGRENSRTWINFHHLTGHCPVERGEWKSAKGGKRERARYSRYGKATFRKDASGRLKEM
jgi:hypothetical protein